MNRRQPGLAAWTTAALLLYGHPCPVGAADQSSPTFRVTADVVAGAAAPLAAGSTIFQASLTVDQHSVAAPPVSGTTFGLAPGFQAACEGFDTDGDGMRDGRDADDDGDGAADGADDRPYDTDNDGVNNIGADMDDDNDGLSDSDEWPYGTSWIAWDTDGDGPSDYAEWIAGTRGNDGSDFFRITSISCVDGARWNLRWAGVAGRRYTVLAAGALDVPPDWKEVWSTNLSETTEVACEPAAPDAEGVFRVRVERPDGSR